MDKIITLHHLASSGGTIICRALAAMHDVVVLGEVHPGDHVRSKYDLLRQLRSAYGGLSSAEQDRIDDHFLESVRIAVEYCRERKLQLVLRDHAFHDFFRRNSVKSRLLEVLKRRYETVSMVTVRAPADQWASLRGKRYRSGEPWFEGSPDEFFVKYESFLDAFDDVPVFRYEDFAVDPKEQLQRYCDVLGLRFNENFSSRLPRMTHITGDSGRRGDVVEPRPKHSIDGESLGMILGSDAYHRLVDRLGYDSNDILFQYGEYLWDLGELEGAVHQYQRVLEVAPNYGDAAMKLGVARQVMGRPVEAIKLLQRALEAGCMESLAWLNLGNAYRDLGRAERAESCYRTSLEKDPTSAIALNNLGMICLDHGDLKEAERFMKSALEVDPGCQLAQDNLDCLHRKN